MRYEVLIMLGVLGAVNLVGRVLAKRAKDAAEREASSELDATGDSTPRVPPPMSVAAPVRRAKVAATQGVPKAEAKRVAQAVRSKRERQARVATPAPPPPAPSRPTVSVLPAAKGAMPARETRNRWNARSLRRAFVASEIFGTPASLRF